MDIDGDDGGAALAVADVLAPGPPDAHPVADVEVAQPEGDILGDAPERVAFPERLLGQVLKREHHWTRHDWGFRVECRRHGGCRRYRSSLLDQDRNGPLACMYHLGAWLVADHLSADDHRKYRPTVADVRAFMESADAP